LTFPPPSTNTSRNTNLLHYTSMIESHSHSGVMAFKGVGTFGTLSVNNPFLNSLRIDGTIVTNYPMVMFVFYDPTSFTTE
jgi:cbb3-type cytochrome oxidase subunit 1